MKKTGEKITYIGGCDVIRTERFNWREFAGDNKELIINKQYEVINAMCNQRVYIKKDGKIAITLSLFIEKKFCSRNSLSDLVSSVAGFLVSSLNLSFTRPLL